MRKSSYVGLSAYNIFELPVVI